MLYFLLCGDRVQNCDLGVLGLLQCQFLALGVCRRALAANPGLTSPKPQTCKHPKPLNLEPTVDGPAEVTSRRLRLVCRWVHRNLHGRGPPGGFRFPRGSIYTANMESGPDGPSPLWFWGPNSIIVVYTDPLGIRQLKVDGLGLFFYLWLRVEGL